jgi:hypothetical protein
MSYTNELTDIETGHYKIIDKGNVYWTWVCHIIRLEKGLVRIKDVCLISKDHRDNTENIEVVWDLCDPTRSRYYERELEDFQYQYYIRDLSPEELQIFKLISIK